MSRSPSPRANAAQGEGDTTMEVVEEATVTGVEVVDTTMEAATMTAGLEGAVSTTGAGRAATMTADLEDAKEVSHAEISSHVRMALFPGHACIWAIYPTGYLKTSFVMLSKASLLRMS